LDESERDELVRLRAELKDAKSENAQLSMQVDFAKKVATWFQDSRHGVIIRERSARVLTSQARCHVTGLVVGQVLTQF